MTIAPPSELNGVGQIAAAQRWRAVACGYKHAIGIDDRGRLWGWGNNQHGQLGLGNTSGQPLKISRIGSLADVGMAAAGQFHTLAIDGEGRLWGAGWSMFGALGNGQLGNESSSDYYTLARIGNANLDGRWTHIDAKGYLSLGLKEDGSLWAWGANPRGAVGNGSTLDQGVPLRVFGSRTACLQASAGWDLAGAIDENGDLYLWGDNRAGQCSLIPAYKDAPMVTTPQQVAFQGVKWKQVAVGETHVLAIDTEGQLWAWGQGNGGQLGLGAGTLQVRYAAQQVRFAGSSCECVQAFAGESGSGAITRTSDDRCQLWVWGEDGSGQASGQTPGRGFVYEPTQPSGTESMNDWLTLAIGYHATLGLRRGPA